MESEAGSIVVILGPTGVGKSATAIVLAGKFGGEIINCDSMQVYRGFDIGTDKIPSEKREGIPHHLLDVIDPSVQFTAADFASMAAESVLSIMKKGKIPFVVGGTGLYLKALLEGLFPGPGRNPELRRRLEKEAGDMGLESLWNKLWTVDPEYAGMIGKNDRMRIIRGLEVFFLTKKPISSHFPNTASPLRDFHILKIGLKLEREELHRRIEQRVDRMFSQGIVREVESLLKKGVAEDSAPFRALGYKHVLKHLKNEISLEDAVDLTKKETRQYAKRQMTWFRKTGDVHWFSPHDLTSISEFLEKNLK